MQIFKLLLILLFVQQIKGFGQLQPDSITVKKLKADSSVSDSSSIVIPLQIKGFGQLNGDSNLQKLKADSISDSNRVAIPMQVRTYQSVLNKLLSGNKFINIKQSPVFFCK